MTPSTVLPALALLSLVTVESGGWALLRFLTENDTDRFRDTFFRAGHAHAGVLLVLSLVYVLYLDRTSLSAGWQWAAGFTLLAGILAQSGGFFLHLAVGEEGKASVGTLVTRSGAMLLAVALVGLAVALLRTPARAGL